MPEKKLYLGLMSGTSADSIDAALVSFASGPQLIAHHSLDIADLRQEIFSLAAPGSNEIHRLNQLDRELGLRFAQAANELLIGANYQPGNINAIGSHGQTLRHSPPTTGLCEHPYSLQVGDPNTISQHTGITTVADFRRRDIAAGGQGAPLVPAFHLDVFEKPTTPRAIVNIGGMANITSLPGNGTLSGYDTGPGNVLMDSWIHRHQGKDYDMEGAWAASGQTLPALLNNLLATPYLHLPPPKSTGREAFNIQWLDQHISNTCPGAAAVDVQATLLEFTARTIVDGIQAQGEGTGEIYLCGGGAQNTALRKRIEALAEPAVVDDTGILGIPPQWVEAVAFAWLAKQTLEHRAGNAPAATGAHNRVILGGVYPA